MVVVRIGRREHENLVSDGNRGSVWEDETFLEMSAHQDECTQCPDLDT